MSGLAEAWDARVASLTLRLPRRLAAGVDWLRQPSRRIVRFAAAILFIAGGCLSILPVFGLWMLPVGFALLAEDVPSLKAPLERSARWLEGMWRRFVSRKSPGDALVGPRRPDGER